ncbi:hypothetical protein MP638_005940 [Amoeboaphelidium occidentale]|nr:hypothetical protein MP638_005940 [Amoeboaphelidium occidentale]
MLLFQQPSNNSYSPKYNRASENHSKTIQVYVFLVISFLISIYFSFYLRVDDDISQLKQESISNLLKLNAENGGWYNRVGSGYKKFVRQSSDRLGFFDNVITEIECERLRRLIDNSNISSSSNGPSLIRKEYTGDELYGRNLYEFYHDIFLKDDSASTAEDWEFLFKIRERLHLMAKKYFPMHDTPHAKSPLVIEFTHMTKRLPGDQEYSHNTHADNCGYDFETKTCYFDDAICCKTRTVTLITYLYTPEKNAGGEFYFTNQGQHDTELELQPKCGRTVMFTSGSENLHGVNKILRGARYALALWHTNDPAHEEEGKENRGKNRRRLKEKRAL